MFDANDWTTDPNEVPIPDYQGKDSVKVSPTEENNQRVIDINNPEVTTEIVKKGLNLTNTFLGYHDGSAWKSYISSTGSFKFNGDNNNYIEWNGSALNIRGSLNADDISTGNLESANWSTTQGSQFNLNDGTFKLGGSSNPKLSWNGSTLSVIGNIDVQNPADVRSDLNVADGADVTADNTSANTNNVGNKTATNVEGSVDKTDIGLNSAGEILKPLKGINLPTLTGITQAGLYLDGSKVGYHDGTNWTNYFSSDGFFKVGNNNNYIEYDPIQDKTTFTGLLNISQDKLIEADNGEATEAIWAGKLYTGYATNVFDGSNSAFALDVHLPNSPETLTTEQIRLRDLSGVNLIRVNYSPRLDDFSVHSSWASEEGSPEIVVKVGLHIYDAPIVSDFVLGFNSQPYTTLEERTLKFFDTLGTYQELIGGTWSENITTKELTMSGIKFSTLQRYGIPASYGGESYMWLNIKDFNTLALPQDNLEGHLVFTIEVLSHTGDTIEYSLPKPDTPLEGSAIISNI